MGCRPVEPGRRGLPALQGESAGQGGSGWGDGRGAAGHGGEEVVVGHGWPPITRTLGLPATSTGRPIFVPGYEQDNPGGAPDRLLNRDIQINQHAPAPAAGATSIAFGDFSYYKIRDVMAVTLFRFNDSAYVKKGQVGFMAWMRSGGNLVDVGGAVKTFKHGAAA